MATMKLETGKTVETGTVRVHMFADHFRAWDLTNAGKRGKTVRTIVIAPRSYSSEACESFMGHHAGSVALASSYDELKAMFSEDTRIEESTERGVDVLPAGTETIKFTTRNGLVVKADPMDFSVLHRSELTTRDGKPTGTYNDTYYHPATKRDAKRFYTWLQENRFRFNQMKVKEVRDNFRQLAVKYDYH